MRNSTTEQKSPAKAPVAPPAEDSEPKTAQKKARRRLPSTPERNAADKSVRRSKRLSDENAPTTRQASPHKPAHARSHAKHERSPSPFNVRPVTVEKKRRKAGDSVEEEKITRIQLPFADTPVIKRNKEMRKASADNGHRRSSSGMRGKRASSLIDEGRGNGEYSAKPPLSEPVSLCSEAQAAPLAAHAPSKSRQMSAAQASGLLSPPSSKTTAIDLAMTIPKSIRETTADQTIHDTALPHSEVPTQEFFKHISAELTEPRRMRCLLGWCGTRALPPKPEAPKESTPASNSEFQALQAGMLSS